MIKRIDEYTLRTTAAPASAYALVETLPTVPASRAYEALPCDLLQAGSNRIAISTATGAQNDFVTSPARVVLLNNASLLTLTGLAAGADGQLLTLVSIGAGQVDVNNQNAGSAAGNRVINGVTATLSLSPGSGRMTLVYDLNATRWRVLWHEQGAAITPTFAAGDFTGNNSMTWTLTGADVLEFRYKITGRRMTLSFRFGNTTVGGTPSTELRVALPGGVTLQTGSQIASCYLIDGGAGASTGFALASSGNAFVGFRRAAQDAFAASTDGTTVAGQITLELS